MDISYRWLRALAAGLDATPKEVAGRLAMYGAPVDEIVDLGAGLEDIRIARVVDTARHPNADRLSLCRVDAGTGELLSVVCGAPNVRTGAFYPFAPVGAVLPGGLAIRKARIRGEVSEGMLCSERELALGREHAGILELHGEFEPGAGFLDALALRDVRLVVDVTPNRPDLLSHVGVARELAPDGAAGVRLPAFPGAPLAPHPTAATSAGERESAAGPVPVRIDDPEGCPRYLGAVLRDVRIAPSPAWLAARLRAVGLRPINNVVDATNYVLQELGQPLHAFDLDRLAGPAVIVRHAAAGEEIVTLDGERRALPAGALVIADAERPIAVAGVMGGEHSEVTAETRSIFLECAVFDPATVRRTRRALALSTDASYRFERGVDAASIELAFARALALITHVAGGRLDGAAADVGRAPQPAAVPLRADRVEAVLGRRFEAAEIQALLEPLGFTVQAGSGELAVGVPGWRAWDVTREIDLVEEIARRYGYDNFAAELRPFRPTSAPDHPLSRLEDRLRTLLAGRGLLEARSLPFVPADAGVVAVLNPLSAAEDHLRAALLPALLRRLEHNFARGARNLRLFEIGTAFVRPGGGELPEERTRLGAVLTGARAPGHWSGAAADLDLWDAKALLADVAHGLGIPGEALRPAVAAPDAGLPGALVPGTIFEVVAGAAVIGCAGRVRPELIDAPAWAAPVWGLEVELSAVVPRRDERRYRPLPVHPATERDVALLVPERTPAAAVEAVVRREGDDLLEAVELFDLYRGAGVPVGVRSVAFRLRFRAPDRTLTDAEADARLGRVLQALAEELDVHRRG
jgi:phenylalanyl-tRNA synthetase beta chain